MIGLSHNASVPSSSGLSLRPVGAAPHPTSTGVSRQSSASSPFAARPVVNNDAAPSRPLATRATDTSRQLPGASHSTPITVPDGTGVVTADMARSNTQEQQNPQLPDTGEQIDPMLAPLPGADPGTGVLPACGSTESFADMSRYEAGGDCYQIEQPPSIPPGSGDGLTPIDPYPAPAPPAKPRLWVPFAIAGGVTALSILGAILFGDA